MPIAWEDAIREALIVGQAGGVVKLQGDPAQGNLTPAVARYILPDGIATPWVLTASPLLGQSGSFPLGTATAAALVVTLGIGNVSLPPVRLDLPAAGAVYQMPPCQVIMVSAELVPILAVDAAWYVGVSPGNSATAAPPVLTAPIKSIAGLSGSTFQRPALARAWRPFSPTFDLASGVGTLPAVQQNASGPVQVDASSATTFFGNNNGCGVDRSGWLPLHPLATEVSLYNTQAGARDFGVQWLLSFG